MKSHYYILLLLSILLNQSCSNKKETGISDAEMAIKVDSAMKAVERKFQEEKDSTYKANNEKNMSNKSYKWVYTQREDKMTSMKNYFAEIDANEVIRFNFPYDGGSVATLTIRSKGKSKDIYLRVSKGQFKSDSDGGKLKIRFDDDVAKNYSYSNASDGSSDIIFLDNISSVLEKIKKSKKMLIQVEFYQEGLRIIEFYTEGLKWEH